MEAVPRHLFVPEHRRPDAYDDSALALIEGQTISQPYIVAYMTAALGVGRSDRVLEIGTGSGYQAAILAKLVGEVYTIEVKAPLAQRAASVLRRLGYSNVHMRCGDGSIGWPEAAPFGGIMVTAAADRIPSALTAQLGEGARLVIPLGSEVQQLHVVTKTGGGLQDEAVLNVRFVPFVWPGSKGE